VNNKILTIVGPTAVGKTSVAIEVAKLLNGEIIGLDSRQIYFDMEIGTAQPSTEEQNRIIHHLIGIRAPNNIITAGEYGKLVNAVIVDVKQRGKTPIICGGAGLYFRTLHEGIFDGSASDKNIRKNLEKTYESDPQSLFIKLKDIDPEYAGIVHINNKKRLVRALEIYELTGKTPSEHFKIQKSNQQLRLELYSILLTMDKDLLFERICQRTELMINEGLIDEVRSLLSNYDEIEVHPIDSIGYKQVRSYLKNDISMNEMIEDINLRTRQYAKKQVTWFKSEPIDLTIEINNYSKMSDLVQKIISNYTSNT
jgi:tRNA dimethylallyltransferase